MGVVRDGAGRRIAARLRARAARQRAERAPETHEKCAPPPPRRIPKAGWGQRHE